MNTRAQERARSSDQFEIDYDFRGLKLLVTVDHNNGDFEIVECMHKSSGELFEPDGLLTRKFVRLGTDLNPVFEVETVCDAMEIKAMKHWNDCK